MSSLEPTVRCFVNPPFEHPFQGSQHLADCALAVKDALEVDVTFSTSAERTEGWAIPWACALGPFDDGSTLEGVGVSAWEAFADAIDHFYHHAPSYVAISRIDAALKSAIPAGT